jgi:hypothetical protein
MNIDLEYPLDIDKILRKKKSIKKEFVKLTATKIDQTKYTRI